MEPNDPAPASGLSEIRFCGSHCGLLDVSWTEWHLGRGYRHLETDLGGLHGRWTRFRYPEQSRSSVQSSTRIFDTTPTANDCAEYADAASDPSHSSKISASVYVYDRWLNLPAAGTTTSVGARPPPS